jgi:DNA-binding response OmpR family regulator
MSAVLIIEDDAALLRGLKDNFEAQNYRVETARDGQSGLSAALARPPDLMVLDVMLPKMNGYEICRAIRARQLEMPIIMLTAKGQEEDIIRGLELGADDYVTKPFSIRQLLARARAFLRRQNGCGSTFSFGACKLDVAAHKLFRDDAEVALTTKEFQLLKFLILRSGRALTRDQILDGVWGNEIIVNDRSVDRCVTTLRAKVEIDPHRPAHIQTIRNLGYRFEPDGAGS